MLIMNQTVKNRGFLVSTLSMLKYPRVIFRANHESAVKSASRDFSRIDPLVHSLSALCLSESPKKVTEHLKQCQSISTELQKEKLKAWPMHRLNISTSFAVLLLRQRRQDAFSIQAGEICNLFRDLDKQEFLLHNSVFMLDSFAAYYAQWILRNSEPDAFLGRDSLSIFQCLLHYWNNRYHQSSMKNQTIFDTLDNGRETAWLLRQSALQTLEVGLREYATLNTDSKQMLQFLNSWLQIHGTIGIPISLEMHRLIVDVLQRAHSLGSTAMREFLTEYRLHVKRSLDFPLMDKHRYLGQVDRLAFSPNLVNDGQQLVRYLEQGFCMPTNFEKHLQHVHLESVKSALEKYCDLAALKKLEGLAFQFSFPKDLNNNHISRLTEQLSFFDDSVLNIYQDRKIIIELFTHHSSHGNINDMLALCRKAKKKDLEHLSEIMKSDFEIYMMQNNISNLCNFIQNIRALPGLQSIGGYLRQQVINSLVNHRHYLRALDVIRQDHKDQRFVNNDDLMNLKQLAIKSPALADAILSFLKARATSDDPLVHSVLQSLYTQSMEASVKNQQYESVLRRHNEMKRQRIQISAECDAAKLIALQALGKTKTWRKVYEKLEDAKEEAVIAAKMKIFNETDNVELAVKQFKTLVKQGPLRSWNAIDNFLRVVSRHQNKNVVCQIGDLVLRQKLPVQYTNSVLKAFSVMRCPSEALLFFKKALTHHDAVSCESFNIMFDILAMENQVEASLDLYQICMKSSLAPSKHHMNRMIQCMSWANMHDTAIGLWQQMKVFELANSYLRTSPQMLINDDDPTHVLTFQSWTPNLASYHAALHAYGHARKKESVLSLVMEMIQRGTIPTISFCESWVKIADMMQDAQQAGAAFLLHDFQLNPWCKTRRQRVIDFFVASFGLHLDLSGTSADGETRLPAATLYNHVIRAYAVSGDAKETLRWIERYRHDYNNNLNAGTYLALNQFRNLDVLTVHDAYKLIESTVNAKKKLYFGNKKKLGYFTDDSMNETFIEGKENIFNLSAAENHSFAALFHPGDYAKNAVQRKALPSFFLYPSINLCNSLVWAHARAGDHMNITKVIKIMINEWQRQPDMTTWNALMFSYLKCEKPDDVLDLWTYLVDQVGVYGTRQTAGQQTTPFKHLMTNDKTVDIMMQATSQISENIHSEYHAEDLRKALRMTLETWNSFLFVWKQERSQAIENPLAIWRRSISNSINMQPFESSFDIDYSRILSLIESFQHLSSRSLAKFNYAPIPVIGTNTSPIADLAAEEILKEWHYHIKYTLHKLPKTNDKDLHTIFDKLMMPICN